MAYSIDTTCFYLPHDTEALTEAPRDTDQLIMARVADFHSRGIMGAGVIVAIVDSGINGNHPDFMGRILPGKAWTPDGDPLRDGYGHGSHVAGLIAGSVTGIAPKAEILPLKVFDDNARAYGTADAVRYALAWRHPKTGRRVDIINLSLAGTNGALWRQLMDECEAAGVTVACGAGNYGENGEGYYPATLEYPIVVGAITREKVVTDFSSRISQLDVCQLGKSVYSCSGDAVPAQYVLKSGTSMSTPIVAGMLALYKCEDATRADMDLYRCLMSGIEDLGPQGRNNLYGFGMAYMAGKESGGMGDTQFKYSLKTDGETRLSANFKVKEFACAGKYGSDEVLIDPALVYLCQAVRDHFGAPVTIHSGYRTAAHNNACGGAKSSYHLTGQAADLKVSGVDPIRIALYCQNTLDVPGIGLYSYADAKSGFVHVDTRKSKWRGLQIKSSGGSESIQTGYFVTVRKGDRGNTVVVLQRLLGISDDGVFGSGTEAAVKAYQQTHGLAADGIAGRKTFDSLINKL